MNKEPLPENITDKEVYKTAFNRFSIAYNEQIESGRTKYGTTLKIVNGRNPYNDFLQEFADGLQYVTQIYLQLQHIIAFNRAIDLNDLDLLNSQEFVLFISNIVNNIRILSDEEYNKIKESFIRTTVDV